MTKNRILTIITLSLLLITCLLPTIVFAGEKNTVAIANLDQTNVLDDLMSNEDFDLQSFTERLTGSSAKPELITFVEYCYSPYVDMQSAYRLYVYMFNPGGNVLSPNGGHTISIGTKYNDKGKPQQYETFDLELVNVSRNLDDQSTYNIFWKFRVVDRVSGHDGKTIQNRVNPTARKYDVAGIQLTNVNNQEIFTNDYAIGCSYTYTGYATGMSHLSNEMPLEVKAENLDHLTLDVRSTYYRTQTSSKGNGWHNDVNAVYFSVPNKYFTDYGELKRIKAEWYEFLTQPIVVTSHQDFYNYVYARRGQPIMHDDNWVGYTLTGVPNPSISDPITAHWVFHVNDITSSYDPDLPLLQQGGVSAQTVENYFRNYPLGTNTVNVNGKLYNADLLQEIPDSRKKNDSWGVIQSGFDGKSIYEFDTDIDCQKFDTFDWSESTFTEKYNMLDGGTAIGNIFNILFNNLPEQEEELKNIDIIRDIDPADVNLTKTEFCKKYLINSDDYATVKNQVSAAHAAGNRIILFRFAVTDYYAEDTIIKTWWYSDLSDKGCYDYIFNQAYIAQQSCFLDFDIIQLSFLKDNNYTVIPCVADPINIFSDVTPPVELESPSPLDNSLVGLITLLIYFALIVALIYVAKLVFRALMK